jgi:hypothetical protein
MRTLKEEVRGTQYRNLEEARSCIGEFLEQVYNRQRLHSALGYMTPEEFEQTSEAMRSDGTRFREVSWTDGAATFTGVPWTEVSQSASFGLSTKPPLSNSERCSFARSDRSVTRLFRGRETGNGQQVFIPSVKCQSRLTRNP